MPEDNICQELRKIMVSDAQANGISVLPELELP
jgi:hypothetical protein